PILSRLDSLDLSLGTLNDDGGKALLGNPALKRLKRLDLHRHYLSKQTMTVSLQSANETVRVDFALFCNPESRRVEGFSIALGRVLRQRPRLIPWQRVLEGSEWEKQFQDAPQFLRLESPGRNWKVEQQFLL